MLQGLANQIQNIDQLGATEKAEMAQKLSRDFNKLMNQPENEHMRQQMMVCKPRTSQRTLSCNQQTHVYPGKVGRSCGGRHY